MTTTPNLDLFMTFEALARRWSVSTKTLRRLVARGELPVHRIGNQIRVSREDALTYERSRRGV